VTAGKTRLFIVAFAVTLAAIAAWYVHDRIAFQIDARRVSFDKKTITCHSMTGEWSVQVYNGSSRRLRAVYIEVTVPISETKRVFRLAPRGLLGEVPCEPFSLAECRGKFGDFLPNPRIHGAWKIKGVEFKGWF
jgi:hypothetical protein